MKSWGSCSRLRVETLRAFEGFVVCECSLGVPLITRLVDSAVGASLLISQWKTERNRLAYVSAFHVHRYSKACEAGDIIGVDGEMNGDTLDALDALDGCRVGVSKSA